MWSVIAQIIIKKNYSYFTYYHYTGMLINWFYDSFHKSTHWFLFLHALSLCKALIFVIIIFFKILHWPGFCSEHEAIIYTLSQLYFATLGLGVSKLHPRSSCSSLGSVSVGHGCGGRGEKSLALFSLIFLSSFLGKYLWRWLRSCHYSSSLGSVLLHRPWV